MKSDLGFDDKVKSKAPCVKHLSKKHSTGVY